MIKIYTNNCPKCQILEKKLEEQKIEYEKITDIDLMLSMGITEVPVLELEDKKKLSFGEAIKWLKNRG